MKKTKVFKPIAAVFLCASIIFGFSITAIAVNGKTNSEYLFELLGDNSYNHNLTLNKYSDYAELSFPKFEVPKIYSTERVTSAQNHTATLSTHTTCQRRMTKVRLHNPYTKVLLIIW